MKKKIHKLPKGESIDEFAKEVFGDKAYVPKSIYDPANKNEAIGYIEADNGTYAVVLLEGE